MLCYICGRICDKTESGLCAECQRELAQNNERIMLLALLNEAQMFCPLALQNRIEDVLIRIQSRQRKQLPHFVKEKSP